MSDWDFYEGRMDDDRAFISIDLSLVREAPLVSHPVKLEVRFAMQDPRADGLRSAEEAPAVFAVEDRVTAAISSRADVRFAARIVGQGYTSLLYYVPDGSAVADALEGLGDVAPYELEWLAEDDATWSTYEMLFPNRYAMQSIQNRRLVTQMTEVGDCVDVPREIDHFASFASEVAAADAATALAARGFRVDPPNAENDRWSLQFHREDACGGTRPDEFVFEILDLLDPFDGEYDGWGSMIVRG